MPNHTVYLVRDPTEEEIAHMVELHVKAYEGDPATGVMLGNDWSLSGDLGQAIIRATLLEGELYAVKDGDKIVSYGAWFSPGTGLFATPEQRALGWDQFFEKLKPEIQYWFNHTVREISLIDWNIELDQRQYPDTNRKHAEAMFTDEERQRRWWCPDLVTDPASQGRGYATAIVDCVFRMVRGKGGFIGLATTKPVNVRKYTSMGFRERGSYNIPSPIVDLENHILTRET
ncbi:hypothetical protein VNI00_018022 [Paramarasmius palmivorus]|uniref:N-acetyltransferase domain-containing protein n=1 Tax=Paramarasmius palmivorus TaxID=297713 RepID=A0AAW0B1B3_9AGAR